jgi:hypothetical protein
MVRLARADLGRWAAPPPFVYPPLLVVLFVPLTKLPYFAARLTWLAINQACLFVALVAMARIYTALTGARLARVTPFVAGLVAAALYSPLLNHEWQGQSNLLILALTSWALYVAVTPKGSSARDAVGGALLATAILLKVFPAIFVPYLLAQRRYRLVAWTAVMALVITAVTLAVVPWTDYLRFPGVLLGSVYLRSGGDPFANHSMQALGDWLVGRLGVEPNRITRVAIATLRFVPPTVCILVTALEARHDQRARAIAASPSRVWQRSRRCCTWRRVSSSWASSWPNGGSTTW